MQRIAFVLLLLLSVAGAQSQPKVVDVFREFDRIGAQPLWPGFGPRTVPVEVFDGASTYLFHHPKPPEGFHPLEGVPGVFVFDGQHDTVRANTGTEVNGVPTATAGISKSRSTIPELAALLIHETFHVYEKQAHPKWAANEGELFTYPLDDAKLLQERRLETRALVRALAAKNDRDARCWAEAALENRHQRFARMPAGAAGYERGIELNEGLAQYLEYKSIGKAAALKNEDFPVELIRQRGYASGQAWALLLDRLGGDWKNQTGDTPLDQALNDRFLIASWRPPKACVLPAQASGAELERARREVAELVASREKRKQEFLSAPGWRVEIIAGEEPLWPQGFDPWNVANLGGNAVLHSRWVKMGNSAGSIEALNHPSLTEGVGPHPLFNGAQRFLVTGLEEPKVTEADGKVSIEVPGAKGTFAGKVERSGQVILIKLP
jgi:hypothetical protein